MKHRLLLLLLPQIIYRYRKRHQEIKMNGSFSFDSIYKLYSTIKVIPGSQISGPTSGGQLRMIRSFSVVSNL